jgi:hypothetical protein
VVALAAAVMAIPSTGAAAETADSALSISPIRAVFSPDDRETTYSVPEVEGATGQVRYQWTLSLEAVDPAVGVDLACNNHGELADSHPTFVWEHGNVGDQVSDDGCNHALQGKYGHQGLITVVVSDDNYSCTATYKGTESSDAGSVAAGTASAPTCTAKGTTAPPCKCVRLTARILPKSLHAGIHKLRFRIHWGITCLGGSGGCRGTLDVAQTPGVDIACRGNCGGTTEGSASREVGIGLPFERDEEKTPIVIRRSCQGRVLAPVKLRIVFDTGGDVDLKRSKLH